MNTLLFALLGAVSGALAAAAVDLMPLGDAPAIHLFGHCFGLDERAGHCTGAPGELYVFPGLIFGLVIPSLLCRRRKLSFAGAALFAGAATLANATAVFVFAASFGPLGTLLEPVFTSLREPAGSYLLLGVPGAIAGAVGGGLLGWAALSLVGARGWFRVTATGTVLGPLLNLIPAFHGGNFAFYMIWQAGYAAVLFSRPRRPVPDLPIIQAPADPAQAAAPPG
jgi:hypothetical protein